MTELPASARKVEAALRAAGCGSEIVEFEQSSRTAEDAAAACGCSVGQIVKSLIFRGATSGDGYLILTSGANRVHEKRLGRQLGEKLERADPDFVKNLTGYAIGGIPPIGHDHPATVVFDIDLEQHDIIWAAAGTPTCVFPTTPAELTAIVEARVLTVT